MVIPWLFPEIFLVMQPGMAPGRGRMDGLRIVIPGWVPGVFLGRKGRREKKGRRRDFLGGEQYGAARAAGG